MHPSMSSAGKRWKGRSEGWGSKDKWERVMMSAKLWFFSFVKEMRMRVDMSAASGDGAAAPPSIQTSLPASHFAPGDVCPPFLFPRALVSFLYRYLLFIYLSYFPFLSTSLQTDMNCSKEKEWKRKKNGRNKRNLSRKCAKYSKISYNVNGKKIQTNPFNNYCKNQISVNI